MERQYWMPNDMTPEQFEHQARLAYENVRPATFMPYMIGFFIDSCLLGTIIVLFGMWCKTTRPTEKRILRHLVYWVLLTACGASGWMIGQILHVFATGFSVYSNVRDFSFLRYFGLLSMATRIPISLFLLHRAYKLTGEKKWILIVILPLLLTIVGMCVASVVILKSMADITQSKLYLASAAEVMSDMILTGTIAYRLWRSRKGWENTDKLISRLLLVLAETQLPPAILALIFLIISTSLPRQSTQFILLFHPKVPIICLLVVLLSRVGMEKTVRGSQRSGSSQIPGTLSSDLRSPTTPRGDRPVQRYSTFSREPARHTQTLPYAPALETQLGSPLPLTPHTLDKIDEDQTNASLKSGTSGEEKAGTIGGSQVALVGKKGQA